MKKKEKKQAKKANEKPQAKNKASVKSNKSAAQSKVIAPASKKIIASKVTDSKKIKETLPAISKKTKVVIKQPLTKANTKVVSKSTVKKIVEVKKVTPIKKTVAANKKAPVKKIIAKKVANSNNIKVNVKAKTSSSVNKVNSKISTPTKVISKKPLPATKIIQKPKAKSVSKPTLAVTKKTVQKPVIAKKIVSKTSPIIASSKVAKSQTTSKNLALKEVKKTIPNKIVNSKGKADKKPVVVSKTQPVGKKPAIEAVKKVASKTNNAKPIVLNKKVTAKIKDSETIKKEAIVPAKPNKKEKKETKELTKAAVEELPAKKIVLHKLEIKKNTPAKEGKQKNSPVSPPRELWRPDYSNSSPSIDKYTFVNVNRPEPVKIESIKSTSKPVKFETKKADAKKSELKAQLLNHCLEILSKSVAISKKEMDDAQESANEEKGSTEEKFDSFRESMQTARDMFARQYSEGVNSVSLLNRINPTMEQNVVILGSVVKTDLMNYFVSVSLGEIVVGKEKYIAISTQTPLCQAIFGKKKGDTFKLMNKTYTIKEVF